jgi:hypothetical protein
MKTYLALVLASLALTGCPSPLALLPGMPSPPSPWPAIPDPWKQRSAPPPEQQAPPPSGPAQPVAPGMPGYVPR